MTLKPGEKARIAKQFIEAIPFSKALGMNLDDIGDGFAVISMPWTPPDLPTRCTVAPPSVSATRPTSPGSTRNS